MKALRLILIIFLPVYVAIISIRNYLFDKKIFKSKKVNAKVISVGSISVGGSGKTPVTIFITELLKNSNIKVGVLSRGYRRNSKGYVLVSDGKDIFVTVYESGDEMYHTVLDCKVPAAVSGNRVNGAERLIRDCGVSTIVLDDAFQHRWINRDLDIIVLDQRLLIENNIFVQNLLPLGFLREPFSSIVRADAVIINRKFSEKAHIPSKKARYLQDKYLFTGHYSAIKFVDIKHNTEFGLEEFKDQKSLVVSGIANPKSFLNVLGQTNVSVTNKLIFRDHKDYDYSDVQTIRKQFYITNSHSVITTEKDAVKLIKFSKELDDIDIFYLKIKFVIDELESFKEFILNG